MYLRFYFEIKNTCAKFTLQMHNVSLSFSVCLHFNVVDWFNICKLMPSSKRSWHQVTQGHMHACYKPFSTRFCLFYFFWWFFVKNHINNFRFKEKLFAQWSLIFMDFYFNFTAFYYIKSNQISSCQQMITLIEHKMKKKKEKKPCKIENTIVWFLLHRLFNSLAINTFGKNDNQHHRSCPISWSRRHKKRIQIHFKHRLCLASAQNSSSSIRSHTNNIIDTWILYRL